MASMDIDDLIVSFKTSATISQEASDLANLQAQLSAALMGGRPAQCPTTPTMSSRQLPVDYAQHQVPQQRERRGTMVVPTRPSMSRYGSGSEWERQRQSEIDEEMMVENALFLEDQQPYQQKYQSYDQQQYFDGRWVNPASVPSPTPSPPVSEPSSYEAYAATDPFFAAQLQKTQNPYGFGQTVPVGYGFSGPRTTTFASS